MGALGGQFLSLPDTQEEAGEAGSYPPEPGWWTVFAGGPAWQAIRCNKKQVSALERSFSAPFRIASGRCPKVGGWEFRYPQEPG